MKQRVHYTRHAVLRPIKYAIRTRKRAAWARSVVALELKDIYDAMDCYTRVDCIIRATVTAQRTHLCGQLCAIRASDKSKQRRDEKMYRILS